MVSASFVWPKALSYWTTYIWSSSKFPNTRQHNTYFCFPSTGWLWLLNCMYHFLVNDKSGLPRNSFLNIQMYNFNTSHNVPQNLRLNLRYEGFIGQKVLKLWRQESWPFGTGWAAKLPRICSRTSVFPNWRMTEAKQLSIICTAISLIFWWMITKISK